MYYTKKSRSYYFCLSIITIFSCNAMEHCSNEEEKQALLQEYYSEESEEELLEHQPYDQRVYTPQFNASKPFFAQLPPELCEVIFLQCVPHDIVAYKGLNVLARHYELSDLLIKMMVYARMNYRIQQLQHAHVDNQSSKDILVSNDLLRFMGIVSKKLPSNKFSEYVQDMAVLEQLVKEPPLNTEALKKSLAMYQQTTNIELVYLDLHNNELKKITMTPKKQAQRYLSIRRSFLSFLLARLEIMKEDMSDTALCGEYALYNILVPGFIGLAGGIGLCLCYLKDFDYEQEVRIGSLVSSIGGFSWTLFSNCFCRKKYCFSNLFKKNTVKEVEDLVNDELKKICDQKQSIRYTYEEIDAHNEEV